MDEKRIVFSNGEGGVSILVPSPNALKKHSLEAIAKKDVPEGEAYWIMNTADIPTDRTFRDAWELDDTLGKPNGYGKEGSEF